MHAMKEQSNVGDLISKMSQQVSQMSEQIRKACVIQELGSQKIGKSVERIRQSSADVLHETKIVDSEVVKLGKQTKLLQNEISNFKV
jgi:methyl-accepting chemotaxis protein